MHDQREGTDGQLSGALARVEPRLGNLLSVDGQRLTRGCAHENLPSTKLEHTRPFGALRQHDVVQWPASDAVVALTQKEEPC